MSISKENVRHIAYLARIELCDAEKEKFEKELSAILEFVAQLNEVDTTGVTPMTGGTSLENAMRPDEQTDKSLEGKAAGLLGAAPEKKESWVRVKAIFE